MKAKLLILSLLLAFTVQAQQVAQRGILERTQRLTILEILLIYQSMAKYWI